MAGTSFFHVESQPWASGFVSTLIYEKTTAGSEAHWTHIDLFIGVGTHIMYVCELRKLHPKSIFFDKEQSMKRSLSADSFRCIFPD